MAELTDLTPEATPSACCAPEQQTGCCEPTAKADCCEPEATTCGCEAGDVSTADDIRERVRERYAAAAQGAVSASLGCGVPTALTDTLVRSEVSAPVPKPASNTQIRPHLPVLV